MIYTLDMWIKFWNDYNMLISNIHKRSIKAFKTTVYPDYSSMVAALKIKDKDDIIERNGGVYGHVLQKDFFKKIRKINLKSHVNDRVVYSSDLIAATIGLFPINNEMTLEIFVNKKAPAFLSCKEYEGWAIMFMPRVPQEDKDYGDCEELPRERKVSLKRWF